MLSVFCVCFCTPAETEHVSLSHLQLAQSMRDEAKKLEEFREKQREVKKKVGGFTVVMHHCIKLTRLQMVTRYDVAIPDRTTYGRSTQTKVFTLQEDIGCK